MKRSSRKTVLLVALAALAAVVWIYYRRKKERAQKAGGPNGTPPLSPEAFGPLSPEPAVVQEAPSPAPAETSPPVFIADETEALARILASEAADRASQIRIGWVARNRAAQRGDKSIAKMVCNPCGEQVGNKRPFSSARPATNRTRMLARTILATPTSDDPTRGATNILYAPLQDRNYAAGRSKWDANGVRRRWLRGLDYYGSLAGWDYFGPKGGAAKQAIPTSWFGGTSAPSPLA